MENAKTLGNFLITNMNVQQTFSTYKKTILQCWGWFVTPSRINRNHSCVVAQSIFPEYAAASPGIWFSRVKRDIPPPYIATLDP
jgi:hypothetical protein